jgi:hypothetical protein
MRTLTSLVLLSLMLGVACPVVMATQTESENSQESADRERALKLIDALDTTLAKANSAGERVGRVAKVLREIQSIKEEPDEGNGSDVIDATAELTATLKSQLDKLYVESIEIKDAVERDVLPEQNVTITRIQARLDLMDPDDPDYREVEQIYETARIQQTRVLEQVKRLEASIETLSIVRRRLSDRMRVIDLWREVNLKGDELIKKLDEFNKKVDAIAKELNPIEA